jgi:hypothetical protein
LLPIINNTQHVKPTIMNMPATTDLKMWGVNAWLSPSLVLITGFIENTMFSVETIKSYDTHNIFATELRKVTVINKLTGLVINKFEDYIPDPNVDSFVRTLDKGDVLHYADRKQIMFYPRVKPVPFIPILPKDINSKANFVTLDLKTHKMNNGELFIESAAICVNKQKLDRGTLWILQLNLVINLLHMIYLNLF